MKTVVKNMSNQQQYIELSEVTTLKFYGVLFLNKHKGLIVGIQDYPFIEPQRFCVLTIRSITHPGYYKTFPKSNLSECLSGIIELGHSVYEFDDYKSLFVWLIE